MVVSVAAALIGHVILDHIVWAIPFVVLAACFIVPGLPGALLSFVRTTLGRIVLACVLCLAVGWEGRAVIDARWDRTARLRADLAAAETKAALSAALAAEANRLAIAQRDIAVAATTREKAAAATAETLHEQVDDYASELSSRPASVSCRLSAADTRRLRGIDAPSGRR